MFVNCSQCGRRFKRPPSQVEGKENVFCSHKCYAQWRSENLSGENSPLWTGTRHVDAICIQCSKKFRPLRGDVERGYGKFCSRKCHGKWLSENKSGRNHPCWKGGPVTRICEQCEKQYKVAKWKAENTPTRFCSRKCQARWNSENKRGDKASGWRGGKVKKVCPVCGKIFKVVSAEEHSRKCCSHKCMGKWRSQHYRGENSPTWKGGPEKRICEQCGKTFKIAKSALRRKGHGRFCSRVCHDTWQTGENAPGWRGGKSFEPYGHRFNRILKERIREQQGRKCALCSKRQRLKKLNVHHIDYNKKNNSPDNLIALCTSCHGSTNSRRDYWIAELSNLVRDKYGVT